MSKLLNQNTISYSVHPKSVQLPPLEPETLQQLHQLSSKQQDTMRPLYTRQDLEMLASGKISDIFGPLFAQQDNYRRQVRMPMPPVLFVDRVMKIEGEPGSMSKGKIWTETDITADAWYLQDGHMPPGIMVEAGQADLLLMSWMGVDFYNKGERIYRLLGADITFHGELAKVGDTLCYETILDGFAKLGDLRLAFFRYNGYINGELRISMRNGQAGFFSDKELAESAGIIWDAATAKYKSDARLDPPKVVCEHNRFSPQQIQAFASGDTYGCFGPGFELAQTHTYSPRIETGEMCFIDEITHFDRLGGPTGRGYLRATQKVSPDAWFFKGHFKNDPCMPGTLMAQAGSQLLNFYMAALGYTLDRDGWRFEPVWNQELQMRCRGQCLPTAKEIVYEVFVEEIIAEPYPTIIAHLLGTIDGLKALYAHSANMRMVPDWPLTRKPELLLAYHPQKTVAEVAGIKLDYPALLACAWGKPSDMFGEFYQKFNSGMPVPRLPGPPYHFVTRIIDIKGKMGSAQVGSEVVAEYDVPKDAWYFNENNARQMPFCVLMEIGLQPCGWLSSFIGATLASKKRLHYRNLEGTCLLRHGVKPDVTTLRTHIKLTRHFAAQDMNIQSYDITIYDKDEKIYSMDTTFGLFPDEAFVNQAGLPTTNEERNLFNKPSSFYLDLQKRPTEFFSGELRLANPMLLMIDRITGFWPQEGSKNLGQLRAEKDVDMGEWFFKAHFFQDSVQPGSLGVEAMIQLLQFYILQQNLHAGIVNPRFEPLAIDKPLTWKYRGQVIPNNKCVTTTLEIIEVNRDDSGVYVAAEASLWVDGKRIYETHHLAIRIISAKEI